MTKTRLLLFDIDGTLVNTGGAGVEALKLIVHNRFSAKDDLRDIEIAGKTDRAIIRDILRKYQVKPTEETIASFAEEYIHRLPLSLSRSRGRVLPGIQPLLEKAWSRLRCGRYRCHRRYQLRYRLWKSIWRTHHCGCDWQLVARKIASVLSRFFVRRSGRHRRGH